MIVINSNFKTREELERIKYLLINIDMINGFIRKGNLANKSIERIIPIAVARANEFVNDDESALALVQDWHKKDAVEYDLFGYHAEAGTYESEFIDELKPFKDKAYIYRKNSTNFVFAPNFIRDLTLMTNLKEVLLHGDLTDYCVKNGGITLKNLLDELNRRVRVIVEEMAVDTYDAPGHEIEVVSEQALKDMENNGIIRVKKYTRAA